MGLILTRDAILSASDAETIEVEVPEWGGAVRLQSMSAADRDSLEMEIVGAQENGGRLSNFRARVVARCLVDGDGRRLFTDGDAEALGRKSAAVIRRLFPEAQRLSGLGREAGEDLEGN